jgi:hypothetical protein
MIAALHSAHLPVLGKWMIAAASASLVLALAPPASAQLTADETARPVSSAGLGGEQANSTGGMRADTGSIPTSPPVAPAPGSAPAASSARAASSATSAKAAASVVGEAPPSDPVMYVRDGQLRSHRFTLFVTAQLEPEMKPRLSFVGAHLLTKKTELETAVFDSPLMASHQVRPVMIGDTEVNVSGTVLLFDLPAPKLGRYKSAVRLLPVLKWTQPASGDMPARERTLIAPEEVYLGNIGSAAGWTSAVMLVIGALLLRWSKQKSGEIRSFKPKPWLLLITGPDGYLSLWRAQLMIWTFAVASLVFLFGLMQLKVPSIPETLVSLMGLSLATGVLGKFGQPSATKAPPPPAPGPEVSVSEPVPAVARLSAIQAGLANERELSPNWFDLISTWDSEREQVELSIPKAQMVVWTLVIILLFCVKSVLGGELWAVPWELVVLTGFSQAGYLGDKVVAQNKSP